MTEYQPGNRPTSMARTQEQTRTRNQIQNRKQHQHQHQRQHQHENRNHNQKHNQNANALMTLSSLLNEAPFLEKFLKLFQNIFHLTALLLPYLAGSFLQDSLEHGGGAAVLLTRFLKAKASCALARRWFRLGKWVDSFGIVGGEVGKYHYFGSVDLGDNDSRNVGLRKADCEEDEDGIISETEEYGNEKEDKEVGDKEEAEEEGTKKEDQQQGEEDEKTQRTMPSSSSSSFQVLEPEHSKPLLNGTQVRNGDDEGVKEVRKETATPGAKGTKMARSSTTMTSNKTILTTILPTTTTITATQSTGTQQIQSLLLILKHTFLGLYFFLELLILPDALSLTENIWVDFWSKPLSYFVGGVHLVGTVHLVGMGDHLGGVDGSAAEHLNLQLEAHRCWGYGLIFSILHGCYEIYLLYRGEGWVLIRREEWEVDQELNEKAFEAASSSCSADLGPDPDPIHEPTQSTTTTTTLPAPQPTRHNISQKETQVQRTQKRVHKAKILTQLAIDTLDLITPAATVGWIRVDSASIFVGIAGLFSALISLRVLWREKMKQARKQRQMKQIRSPE